MSRKAIRVTLTVYFVIALAFALFMKLTEPSALSQRPAVMISEVVATTIAVLLIPAILPLPFWAIARFGRQYAGVAFTVWGVLAISVMVFSAAGTFYDRALQLEREIRAEFGDQATLSPSAHAEFVRVAKTVCVAEQKASALNRAGGVTDQQINAYCDCTSAYMASAVTKDEMKYIAQNGGPPASIKEKQLSAAATCSQTVLRR